MEKGSEASSYTAVFFCPPNRKRFTTVAEYRMKNDQKIASSAGSRLEDYQTTYNNNKYVCIVQYAYIVVG